MSSVSLTTSLQAKQLQLADLLEQGKLEEGRLVFDSIKDQLGETYRGRFGRFIDLLSRHQGTLDWEKRAQEMGAIFRQYIAMANPTSLQVLAISATKGDYNHFHYPVIFHMQMTLISELIADEQNYPFIDEQLIPAFHIYLKTGCVKELTEALTFLKKRLPYVELFLKIIRENPADLRKPLGSFLPEKDFSGCFDLATLQRRLVGHVFPAMKKIYLLLEIERKKATDAEDRGLVPADRSIQDAKLKKIFSRVSEEFADLFKRAYKRANDNFDRSIDYIKVVAKFDKEDPNTTFGQYASQVKFAISLFEGIKKDLIFLRDFNLLRFTYDLRKLEWEWQQSESSVSFNTFIANKVAKITEKWGPESSRKWGPLLGQWSVIAAEDPAFKRFYQSAKFLIRVVNYEINMFSGLFALPIETGQILGVRDDLACRKVAKKREEKRDEKRRDLDYDSPKPKTPSPPKFSPLSRMSPVNLPSPSLAPVSVALRASPLTIATAARASPVSFISGSPRASPITTPPGIPAFLQTVFAPITTPFRKKDAHRSFKNGSLHIENFSALLERLKRSSENIFSTFALMGASLATAIENLQKSYLYEQEVPFHKSSHNLLRLCADIPFIHLDDIEDLRSVNFAERDTRYFLDTSHRDWRSSFERGLTQVHRTPTLTANLERIGTLFRRTFHLLCRLVNRGAPKEIDLEEVVEQTLEMIQEPATIAEMPSPHPEVVGILETLVKRFSEIPVRDTNREKLVNLLQNLSFRAREEAAFTPSPTGMRVHYGNLFRFLPLITEELIKLLFIKTGVKMSPFAFKHDLLQMLKEAKMDVSKPLQEFLARIPEYARMQRYPARAKYQDRLVKYVSELIGRVQGNLPNPIDKGFKPGKGSSDEAFQELEKALIEEFKFLEEFCILIAKLL